MRRLASLRARLTTAAALIVGATLALASIGLVTFAERQAREAAIEAVRIALLERLDETQVEPFAVTASGTTFEFGVFRREGVLAFGDLYVDGRIIATVEVNLTTATVNELLDPVTNTDLDNDELRAELAGLQLVTMPTPGAAQMQDQGDVLVGAASLEALEVSVAAMTTALVVAVPMVSAAMAAVVWWMVGRTLRPVEVIDARVRTIASGRLDARVPVPDTGDEIAHLATTMNDMLDRLRDADQRQRRFAGDASHELRSPLASIRASAEVLDDILRSGRSIRDADSLTDTIIAEVDRMDSLIGRLLLLARLDQASSLQTEPMNLVEVIGGVVARVDRDIHVRAPHTAPVVGDGPLLAIAVRNLVDNALRHARDTIEVTVRLDRNEAVLTVDDDGPGIPLAQRTEVFERLLRLDDDRSRLPAGVTSGSLAAVTPESASVGAGLGLSLARRIVSLHGGRIVADAAPALGGARIEIRLPVAAERHEPEQAATSRSGAKMDSSGGNSAAT